MRRSSSCVDLILFACCFCCCVLGKHESSSVEDEQTLLLHEAVKNMLGFKETPAKGTKLPSQDNSEDAPKYMMELYEKFKHSPISKGHLSGNTVRSIHAKTGQVNGVPMYLFNLSSIVATEQVISAEIHLYKRKLKHYNKKAHFELYMYEVAPHYMSESGKITLRAESYGWQWFDVTNDVKNCLAARREQSHMLALNFKSEKPNGKTHLLALKKFTSHHSVPFLIIYSNDTQSITFDSLENLATKSKSLLKQDSSNSKQSHNDEAERTSSRVKRDLNSKGTGGIFGPSRSLFTNEIPEDPEDYHRKYQYGYTLPKTHPGMLQARKESRQRLADSRLIPYPPESPKDRKEAKRKRKWRRRNKKRRSKKNRLITKIAVPAEWKGLQPNLAFEDNRGKLCGKRKLIIDFSDIGWGEWIISPKSFEAHYCSGSCPFPMTKKLRPSNHATIQSIVHAIGAYPDVPAPCCVPDTMSSLTLLYFDENRNVVLKNYPSMTVESCACR